ncbi:hypothetical protein CCP4SC76_4720004 [Gammaproteobacteria bacterium]
MSNPCYCIFRHSISQYCYKYSQYLTTHTKPVASQLYIMGIMRHIFVGLGPKNAGQKRHPKNYFQPVKSQISIFHQSPLLPRNTLLDCYPVTHNTRGNLWARQMLKDKPPSVPVARQNWTQTGSRTPGLKHGFPSGRSLP